MKIEMRVNEVEWLRKYFNVSPDEEITYSLIYRLYKRLPAPYGQNEFEARFGLFVLQEWGNEK